MNQQTTTMEQHWYDRQVAIREIVDTVEAEVTSAMQKHGPMASSHEGYAVILEELDELWEEVRKQRHARDMASMEKEAKQIAAMAVRFIYDVVRAGNRK